MKKYKIEVNYQELQFILDALSILAYQGHWKKYEDKIAKLSHKIRGEIDEEDL